MGGLGKSTLAKEVFNRLTSNFEYSCFVRDVKLIGGTDETVIAKIEKSLHYHGKQVEKGTHKVKWRRKPVLLVLDDISGERDEKFLLELEGTTAAESRIIFTSRNQHLSGYSGQIYKVDFLSTTSAEQLFLSCAFPNDEVPPTELIHSIVQKCEGLPLALEVLKQYLRTIKNYDTWEEIRDALGRAEDLPDINERLWEKLQLSYDGLEEKLKQIFLDATTFFSDSHWTLRDAKVVWQVAYETNVESLLWQKLVSMSLVYDVDEDECIRVHEQLKTMGRRMASSKSTNNNSCREWHGNESLKLLQNTEELKRRPPRHIIKKF